MPECISASTVRMAVPYVEKQSGGSVDDDRCHTAEGQSIDLEKVKNILIDRVQPNRKPHLPHLHLPSPPKKVDNVFYVHQFKGGLGIYKHVLQ